MKRQIVFNVTGSPPRQGRLNEADLFTAGSPQVENVRTLLAAASAALRDSEAGPFDDEAYLHLRIILSDSDVPDLSDRLDVARAILRVLSRRGRRRESEAHLGGLAGFSLFRDEAAVRSTSVLAERVMPGTGYEVLVSELAPAAVVKRLDGTYNISPPKFWRGPAGTLREAAEFLEALHGNLRGVSSSHIDMHLTPSGAFLRIPKPDGGEAAVFGPFMYESAVPEEPAWIRLSSFDLYVVYDFLLNNPAEWWWPLRILLGRPGDPGTVRIYTTSRLGGMGSRCGPILGLYSRDQVQLASQLQP